jgi:hypothetical protein
MLNKNELPSVMVEINPETRELLRVGGVGGVRVSPIRTEVVPRVPRPERRTESLPDEADGVGEERAGEGRGSSCQVLRLRAGA